MKKSTPKITPFLSFDHEAEQAVEFYTSIFKNSRVEAVTRCTKAGPRPKGTVLTIAFELEGEKFLALNGGPAGEFSHRISFFVNCETQKEIDAFWEKLSEGGQKVECGWLRDKFGVSWQVVPSALLEMLQDKDEARRERVMRAMMKMKKLDIAGLEAAYKGAESPAHA